MAFSRKYLWGSPWLWNFSFVDAALNTGYLRFYLLGAANDAGDDNVLVSNPIDADGNNMIGGEAAVTYTLSAPL